jgi:thiamine-monophosphate kinase
LVHLGETVPLGELQIIERIRRLSYQSVNRARRQSRFLLAGIGDDCAALRIPSGHDALITTDFSLEDVHFRRKWHPADVVGHRCLARGLSDIAAMGGTPLAAFLSLALPPKIPQRWVDDFLRGFLKLAGQFNVVLAGGDTAQSPAGVLADIAVIGSVPREGAVLRSGARPGDLIYVTGKLGGAAAVLRRLFSKPRIKLRPSDHPAHFYPIPRVDVGKYLREQKVATAMIDISDGLSTDLNHICEESGVAARIVAEQIPVSDTANLALALNGGDDYELLFTARPGKRVSRKIAGISITRIGEIVGGRGMRIQRGGSVQKLSAQGWEHFQG